MTHDQAIAVFAALGSEIRYSLWLMLIPQGHTGIPAGVLAQRLDTAPSRLSFHLRALLEAQLIQRRRVNRSLVYAVNQTMVAQLAEYCSGLGKRGQMGS